MTQLYTTFATTPEELQVTLPQRYLQVYAYENTAKLWNQNRSLLADRCIKKLWYAYIMVLKTIFIEFYVFHIVDLNQI